MGYGNRKIKGQSALEVALTFIVIFLLLGGIIKIWLWSNNRIVERQLRYNETRVAAGTAEDNYLLQWPVYTPKNLTEDEVLLQQSAPPEEAK